MRVDPILSVPMLGRKWLPVAYALFPLPFILLFAFIFLRIDFPGPNLSDLIYGCWAAGFIILNLTREKIEDEMVKSFRLQAYHTGFYWLLSGLGAVLVINVGMRFFGFNGLPLSAALVLWMLNAYIFFAFQYQKYKASRNF